MLVYIFVQLSLLSGSFFRYTIYLFTSLDSFTWGNAKGAIIVIIIVLIRTIVVFTLKFKRAGREKDDKQTNHPSSRKNQESL